MNAPNELEELRKAVATLRDYFEKEGKLLIVGLAFAEPGDESIWTTIISTTARPEDYYSCSSRWAWQACNAVDEPDEP